MKGELKSVWIVAAVVGGIAAVALLVRTSEELLPALSAAHVAIQVEGRSAAVVGPSEARAGTGFTLHAVVEATDWRGRTIYYTDAEALEIGGTAVAPASLRRWDRGEKLRILWFTVEGVPPYTEIESLEDLERPRYREIFQADWAQAWSVPGSVAPAVENFLPDDDSRQVDGRFGTQRFQVRVELFTADTALVPSLRLRSPGAESLEADGELAATFAATLDWPLTSVSRFFGLPQVEPVADSSPELLNAVARQTAGHLLFSRLTVLRSWLDDLGLRWEELAWQAVELTGEAPWPNGGLVRAGSKVSILLEDRGQRGRLDAADLCLDFDHGATVRTLEEVFVGEGLVEMATVDGASRSAS